MFPVPLCLPPTLSSLETHYNCRVPALVINPFPRPRAVVHVMVTAGIHIFMKMHISFMLVPFGWKWWCVREGASRMPPSFIQSRAGTDVPSAGEDLIYENDIVYAWLLPSERDATQAGLLSALRRALLPPLTLLLWENQWKGDYMRMMAEGVMAGMHADMCLVIVQVCKILLLVVACIKK